MSTAVASPVTRGDAAEAGTTPPGDGRLTASIAAEPRGWSGEVTDTRGWGLVERWVALLLVGLVALRIPIAQGVTVSAAVAYVTVPLWWRPLWSSVSGRLVLVVTTVAAASGLWLGELSRQDHAVSSSGRIGTTSLLLGIAAAAGVLVWARRTLPAWQVATVYGIGTLMTEVMVGDPSGSNTWKFVLAVPLTFIVLGLAAARGMLWPQVAAGLAIAGISATHDSRSHFATVLLTIALVAWQARPRTPGRRASTATTVLAMAIVATSVYNIGTGLLVKGYLGEETKQRSIAQIEAGGSILVGGRPELAATLALIRDRPWGFGSGVVPTTADVLVAKSGMADINYDPNNGYVETYMFGGQIKLHSVTGDLWSSFGIAGLVMAATILVLLVAALARHLARRTADAVMVFAICATLWNLAFSPLYGSARTLVLAIGLAVAAPGVPRLRRAVSPGRAERS